MGKSIVLTLAAIAATAAPFGLLLFTGVSTTDLVDGERVEISCDSGACTLSRGGVRGRTRPVGTFPEAGMVAVDPNCRIESRVGDLGLYEQELCRPGLWLSTWSGPVDELDGEEQSFDLAPDERRDDAVFVPLTARTHGAWRGGSLGRRLSQSTAEGSGTWRIRADTHRLVPFRYIPAAIAVEAVLVGAAAIGGARYWRRNRPADRPGDAVFVPLAGRAHGGWRGNLTVDDLDRAGREGFRPSWGWRGGRPGSRPWSTRRGPCRRPAGPARPRPSIRRRRGRPPGR